MNNKTLDDRIRALAIYVILPGFLIFSAISSYQDQKKNNSSVDSLIRLKFGHNILD